MAGLRVHLDRRDRVRSALLNSRYNGQTGLAIDANLAYSTVWNFFNCKPIAQENFRKLCQLLNLEINEIIHRDLIEAPMDEEIWEQELLKPCALIRIQAPFQFGKTTLMMRMLDRVEREGHITIYVNINIILNEIRAAGSIDPQTFLYYFIREIECLIQEQIEAFVPLVEYESLVVDKFGHMRAALKYISNLLKYIQTNTAQPLTIAINRLDGLLDYPDTANTFLPLLRAMNEKSKLNGVWRNLRLILAYSTPAIPAFIGITDHQSPFNVGYQILIPEFTLSQLKKLALQRRLTLNEVQIAKWMELIGGIPSLAILTFDRIQHDLSILDLSIDELIDRVYHDHLRTLAHWLDHSDLRSVMRQIATHPEVSQDLSLKQQCLLHRQGLVIFAQQTGVKPRCQLYRIYFSA